MPAERGIEFLIQVDSDIKARDKANEAARIARETLDRKGFGIYKKIWEIIGVKGTTDYKPISTFSGHGLYGSRIESFMFHFTRAVDVMVGDRTFSLNLEEILTSGSGYSVSSDAVAIKAKMPSSGESQIIFQVDKEGKGKDHFGNNIEGGEIFDKVAALLLLIDEKLPLPEPVIKPKRSLKGSIKETLGRFPRIRGQ